jgi:hypothetical protein
MATPTAYATDDDVRPYMDPDLLGDLGLIHVNVAKEINRDLRARGLDDEDSAENDFDDLSAQTISDLKIPAAFLAISMALTASRDLEMHERGKWWRKEYEKAMAATKIKYDTDDDGTTEDEVEPTDMLFLG